MTTQRPLFRRMLVASIVASLGVGALLVVRGIPAGEVASPPLEYGESAVDDSALARSKGVKGRRGGPIGPPASAGPAPSKNLDQPSAASAHLRDTDRPPAKEKRASERARAVNQSALLKSIGTKGGSATTTEGLLGASGGTISGAGGLGTRGVGIGGGGKSDGLGGLATKGRGAGRSGYGGGQVLGEMDAALTRVDRPDPSVQGPTDSAALTETAQDAKSTFAADVDTGSYTFARRVLRDGRLPRADAVRVEEFVNFFRYDYAQPTGDRPLAVDAEVVPHPERADRHIVRIGVQAKTVAKDDRKPVRLTFLVDTSGSMRGVDRLGLAQRAMQHTLTGLGAEDTVAIVTYAGSTRVVLPPTPATQRSQIRAAIADLQSGGGTAMDSGMSLAYQQAEASYAEGAENRVIVLSDGDANIGRTHAEDMLSTIRRHAEGGITLTTVGFGTGNFQDARMERLADAGDGVYVYLDSFEEAQRVFGRQLGATLETIARDVKLQVEFAPEAVVAWRQVGYENRQIADHDFRNDAVDAGEVGSGHQVTALYEVELADGYDKSATLATVHLRAKPPGPDRPALEWTEDLSPSLVRSAAYAGPDTRMALAAMSLAEALHDRNPAALDHSEAHSERLQRDGRDKADELAELALLAGRLMGRDALAAAAR